jgi:protein-L-isoaspartate(D-aspartate) O-methyltransferase
MTLLAKDTYRHKGLRKELIALLAKKGITDQKVLAAIERVPRHLFLGEIAFPIGEGQTISQPHTVAYQSQLLELLPGEKVLEIGTGSGYQAAVLAELGVKVFSIERHRKLYDKTRTILNELGYKAVKMFFGDGFEGLETFAPFDKIIVTAAAPHVPEKLLTQLMLGGQMVLPLEINGATKMVRITRLEEKEFDQEIFSEAAFVPMLKGKVQ